MKAPSARNPASSTGPLAASQYESLAEFRYLIRRFLAFSEEAAQAAGLTPRQHQALLAIKGYADGVPTVGALAERLGVKHHSAVELVGRLVEAGLILRTQDTEDRRRMLISLTPAAENLLASLSVAHIEELSRLRPTLVQILVGLKLTNSA